MESKTPAATAEPITPDTFGPIACITRWFWGLACNPTWLTTRAAMGTADTPAAPIKGLIGIDESRFINFASKTPDAVPMAKAITPRIRIPTVSRFKNWVASNLLPTPVSYTHLTLPTSGVV